MAASNPENPFGVDVDLNDDPNIEGPSVLAYVTITRPSSSPYYAAREKVRTDTAERLRTTTNLSEQMISQIVSDIKNYRGSDDQPRDDHGRFGSGGSGSEQTGGLAATASWLKSASASEVISAVAGSHRTKEAISVALQSLLSHTTGLDASTWKLNEDLVEHTVSHFAEIATVTTLQAKSLLQETVSRLRSLRPAPAKAADGDDEVLAALDFLSGAIDDYQPKMCDGAGATAVREAVNAAHEEFSQQVSTFAARAATLGTSAENLTRIESELGDGEEYADPADQADWDERVSNAMAAAASAATAARGELQTVIAVAQAHLDEISARIDEHVG